MIFWPVEGLERRGTLPVERKSMFLSQIAARPQGLKLAYRDGSEARRAANLIQEQLRQAGLRLATEEGEGASAQNGDTLREVLEEYMNIPGMKAAILVSDQGLVVASVAQEGVDTSSIAALAVDAVAAVQNFGAQIQAGTLDTMRIEFDKLSVVAAPFSSEVTLVLVAEAGSLGVLSKDLNDRSGVNGSCGFSAW